MPNLGRYLESDGIMTMAVLLDLGWLRDAADNLTRGQAGSGDVIESM